MGFIRGAWRHLSIIPRLIYRVRGWPRLVADCMGQRRRPYRCVISGGASCDMRPGTSDWWIFLEVFVFENYRRAEKDIRQAKIIVDIGANVGFFALYASYLNPQVAIHAFEPFPKNANQLKNNLLLNSNCRIHFHPEAVSDKTGAAALYFTPGIDSGCSLSQPKSQSCSVNVVSINDLFNLCGVEKIDLLKLDCEGSELGILSAISREQLSKIRSVIMEYHDLAEVESLQRILFDSGFKCELFPQINTLYASQG